MVGTSAPSANQIERDPMDDLRQRKTDSFFRRFETRAKSLGRWLARPLGISGFIHICDSPEFSWSLDQAGGLLLFKPLLLGFR